MNQNLSRKFTQTVDDKPQNQGFEQIRTGPRRVAQSQRNVCEKLIPAEEQKRDELDDVNQYAEDSIQQRANQVKQKSYMQQNIDTLNSISEMNDSSVSESVESQDANQISSSFSDQRAMNQPEQIGNADYRGPQAQG